jgi:hypothetical protein
MAIKTVNWLYFRRSGVGPSSCIFHCFRLLEALSNDLATLSLKRVTQSVPRHCISLLAVHQKGEAVQQAKQMMQWATRYWNNQLVAFQFLPGSCIEGKWILRSFGKRSILGMYIVFKATYFFVITQIIQGALIRSLSQRTEYSIRRVSGHVLTAYVYPIVTGRSH